MALCVALILFMVARRVLSPSVSPSTFTVALQKDSPEITLPYSVLQLEAGMNETVSLMQLRQKQLDAASPALSLQRTSTRLSALFAGIDATLPWKKQASVAGDTAPVRIEFDTALVNPLLLLSPKFFSGSITPDGTPEIPLEPILQTIKLSPANNLITASLVLPLDILLASDDGIPSVKVLAQFHGFNASDLGLLYCSVAPQESTGIHPLDPTKRHFRTGAIFAPLKGESGSDETRENALFLQIAPQFVEIVSIPAKIVFHLFEKEPSDADDRPVLKFVLEVN
jgi:hypothetical protein